MKYAANALESINLPHASGTCLLQRLQVLGWGHAGFFMEDFLEVGEADATLIGNCFV